MGLLALPPASPGFNSSQLRLMGRGPALYRTGRRRFNSSQLRLMVIVPGRTEVGPHVSIPASCD